MNTAIKNALEQIDEAINEAHQCEQELRAILKKYRQTLNKSRRGTSNVINAITNMEYLQKKYSSEADYYKDFNQYLRD